jgi:hypothetical protein
VLLQRLVCGTTPPPAWLVLQTAASKCFLSHQPLHMLILIPNKYKNQKKETRKTWTSLNMLSSLVCRGKVASSAAHE